MGEKQTSPLCGNDHICHHPVIVMYINIVLITLCSYLWCILYCWLPNHCDTFSYGTTYHSTWSICDA